MEDKFYYSISEVAKEFNVTLPTLRYWEKEFKMLQPDKNKRGVRFYKKKDVEIIRQIIYLTKEKGYTISGARNILENKTQNDTDEPLLQNLIKAKEMIVSLKEKLKIED